MRSEPGDVFNIHAIYMGPWDIMSQHYYRRREPPVGISSFTKIRLGWISSKQVVLAQPGETVYAFLSPLAEKGDTLVVKIPLKQGRYYLIENRQPIGFDRILPDSGILILKVDPQKPGGSGPVRLMDPDPKSMHFSRATFRLDHENRNLFLDKGNNIAVIPLWPNGDKLGVLITTPPKSLDALKAALAIQELLKSYPEPRKREEEQLIEKSIMSFKPFDFKKCYQVTQQVLTGRELERKK